MENIIFTMPINTPAELEAKLIELSPILHEKFNVSKIGYFGSFARGEQTETSDIDILIDEDTEQYWDVKEYLEPIVNRKVDVVPKKMLRREIAPGILEDVKFYVNGDWISGFELSPNKERIDRMKKHELYLLDMRDSMQEIVDYMNEIDYTAFCKNKMLRDAVQRHLIIIGEAANKVPRLIQDDYPAIPWSELVKWRNDLVHEYFGFDTDKTWDTVQNAVLPNISEMQRIVNEECHQ